VSTKKPTYKQLESKLKEAVQIIELLRCGQTEASDSGNRMIGKRLQQVEAALKKNEERLRFAVEGADLGIWDRDFRTNQTEWNLRVYELLGRDPKKKPVPDETFFEYIHPADRDRVHEHFDREIKAGNDFRDEFRIVHEDGEMRWLASVGRIYHDDQGNVIRMSGIIYDVTERKRAEEQLRQSEQRYMLTQQLAGIGSWDWDIRSGKVEWSGTINRLFGLEKENDFKDYHYIMRFVHPEDRKLISDAINACIEEGIPYDVEHRVIWPDKTEHWLRQTGNVIRDENRLAVRMMGMVQDVTGQKQAAENQHLLAEIFSESQDAIVVRNLENVITSWNSGAERIYGYTAEEMIGQRMDRILPPERLEEHAQLLRRIQAGEHIRHFETERIRKDSRWIHVAISFSPLRNDARIIYAVATIEHDITERVNAEMALREAKQNLEARVQERTRALQISNSELEKEIRQRIQYQEKLQSLTAQLIRIEERQRREIATSLHDSVIQLLVLSNIKLDQLINNPARGSKKVMKQIHGYLDRTIHELRSMTFQISPPILYELGLISALEWLCERFAKEYGLICHLTDDHLDKPVSEDIRNMLFQAVQELFINIVKHAKATHVGIQMKKMNKQIVIEVTDDGRGFDADHLKTDMDHAFGFGLFNIQERLRFMKGHFYIRSEINNGTTVKLQAPLDL
jgi:PAS domain S-box-containing protein